MFVPLSYNLKSLLVRRASTALTVVSIGATVAVLAGVLSLQQGFETLFKETGRADVAVFLRPGAGSEGESGISREKADVLKKSLAEIALNAAGLPLASAESYLAVRMRKLDSGETNVPIRGVEPMTFEIFGDQIRVTAGQRLRPGTDEVIVGRKLTRRVRGCQLGEVITLNTTPFRVVGVFDCEGPFSSEIWGDLDRIADALERPVYNRVIARLKPGLDVQAFAERMADHKDVPVKVQTERAYLADQTGALSITLRVIGVFLATIMGVAAVFTSTNTMLAALAARSHEIGILLSVGFRPIPVFLSFMSEALVLGLFGGVLGILITLPLSGVETGTTNWNTFTEVAFAFRVTPQVMKSAILFALILGLFGGALPAWRAARMDPVEALRRR